MPERAVVADSTVLIFLGKLRALEYLADSYSSVLVPPVVYEEVVERGKEVGARDAALVESAVEAGEIAVVETEIRDEVARYDLEDGETAVLSLALDRDHDEVLADEESVREVARMHDLRPRGTLHFLFDALKRGETGVDGFLDRLDRLLDEGFYLDQDVYLEAIRAARDIVNEADEDP